jgi:ankyrin repeat protein
MNAELSRPDSYGKTPMHRLSWGRDVQAVERLLAAGVDIDAEEPSGGTLLHCAASRGDLPWARLLLDHGANPNAAAATLDDTPLSRARLGGHAEVVNYILAHGAGAPLSTEEGSTARQSSAKPVGGRAGGVEESTVEAAKREALEGWKSEGGATKARSS